jgi:hypothetical protein
MGRKLPFGASELTTDADTGTWGVIIWLGTTSEKRALKEAPALVPFPDDFNDIEKAFQTDKEARAAARSGR